MSNRQSVVKVHCLPFREYFSADNIKSTLRGFVYEYETPKIVTIHSVSIALMCRLIQLLILIYGIAYLMIHKKGYQETDTSIISSITLKVKGIGYNQTGDNHTLVIDGADYIVPPQENNALFLMTNFIRTDQEHKRCEESPFDSKTACPDNAHCEKHKNYQKANGKWTGRCLFQNNSSVNKSRSKFGRCELEGWCPVENDVYIPEPIRDALNFTIFVKNFIEFPRFKVIRKNIQFDANYLKSCNYDNVTHKTCPIFRVGTLLDIVESNRTEQHYMLKSGGVIRVKIDWNCNLDKHLDLCLPEYTFGRLDASYKEQSFSHGFNFRFASHWKYQNRSYRTLTKAYGLRFIISVSGHAGKFDLITLTLNIGSLIGILGLATFICDIVALYVHRQSDVYRQQKFQDVDLNLLQLETLNTLPLNMMSDEAKENHANHVEQAILTGHIINRNNDFSLNIESPHKEKFRRDSLTHQDAYDDASSLSKSTNQQSTPMLIYGNYHQQKLGLTNSLTSSPLSLSSIKQRRSVATRPSQLKIFQNDKNQLYDKTNIVYVDDDTPDLSERTESNQLNDEKVYFNPNPSPNRAQTTRITPKIETFL
ncbi:unnamed protein product [Adineta steineri]|uniref:Purinergic receptor n=2 Tax=Adineta steineri TaxID=433720 RepID=A0A818PJ24_9BILA|nr:unnamed protein product [Adineta steineri]CAF3622440.1 unnamed protein product [Adineta steineri]